MVARCATKYISKNVSRFKQKRHCSEIRRNYHNSYATDQYILNVKYLRLDRYCQSKFHLQMKTSSDKLVAEIDEIGIKYFLTLSSYSAYLIMLARDTILPMQQHIIIKKSSCKISA